MIKESELILNPDGSIFHLKLKPENISAQVWYDAPSIPTIDDIQLEIDPPSVEEIVAGVWDEDMTTHDKPNSFGKRLRDIFPTLWGIK